MAKIGKVVRIRLSPQDCLSVVDIVNQTNSYIPGMSFANAVSAALQTALATLRSLDIVPTRDGFEFLEMMQKFETTKGHRKVLSLEQAVLAHPDALPKTLLTPPPSQDKISRLSELEKLREEMELRSDSEETRAFFLEYRELEREVFKDF